jgi:hypothetical protein
MIIVEQYVFIKEDWGGNYVKDKISALCPT